MLRSVSIDETGLGEPTPARREEWRLAAAELLEDHALELAGAATLEVSVSEGAAILRCACDGGELVALTIAEATLRPHVTEYVSVCRTLGTLDDEGLGSVRLEALDMAKKVAHDAAARTLVEHTRVLGPDHRTARRLFTLLLTMLVDTTLLTTLRGHRARPDL